MRISTSAAFAIALTGLLGHARAGDGEPWNGGKQTIPVDVRADLPARITADKPLRASVRPWVRGSQRRLWSGSSVRPCRSFFLRVLRASRNAWRPSASLRPGAPMMATRTS